MELTSKNPLGGLLIFISGLLILPNTYQLIDRKLNGLLSNNKLRIVVVIVLLFLGIQISPNTDKTQTPNTEVQSPSVEETTNKQEEIVNQAIDNTEPGFETGTVVSVSDGDTLRVQVNGEEMNIRLIGIDTPEIHHQSEPIQCYGPEAQQALSDLVLSNEVRLEKDVSDKDVYDRYLRYLWLDETLVNEYMTMNGYAFASAYPPDTKYQNRIDEGQVHAENSQIGLWAFNTCNGDVYTGTYKDPNISPNPPTQTETTPQSNTNNSTVPIIPVVPATSSKYTCNCSKACASVGLLWGRVL